MNEWVKKAHELVRARRLPTEALQQAAIEFAAKAKDVLDSAKTSAEGLIPAGVREALAKLTPKQTLGIETMQRALLQGTSITAVSLRTEAGALQLQLESESGVELRAALRVDNVFFAPRGAKEISFRVEPAHLASNATIRECVGAISAEFAHKVWPFAIAQGRSAALGRAADNSTPTAVAADCVRVDLREVPAVAAFFRRAEFALFADLVGIDASKVAFTTDGLVFELKLNR